MKVPLYFSKDDVNDIVQPNTLGRPRVITMTNNKGGTGKTTLIASLGYLLTQMGKRVLFVNMDAQRNLELVLSDESGVHYMLQDGDKTTPSIYTVLTGQTPIQDAIIHTPSGDLIRTTNILYSFQGRYNNQQDNLLVRTELQKVYADYDYILIDTGPRRADLMTIMAYFAADYLVIPCFQDNKSLGGMQQTHSMWAQLRNNPDMKASILGIVVNNYRANFISASFVDNILIPTAASMRIPVFETRVNSSAAAVNSDTFMLNPILMKNSGKFIKDCCALLEEMLARMTRK